MKKLKDLVRELYVEIEPKVDFGTFANVANNYIKQGKIDAQNEIGTWDDEYEDEEGTCGYWDAAADIATNIGTELDGENKNGIFANEWGQEMIYNFIKM